jgi:hypothetical protein
MKLRVMTSTIGVMDLVGLDGLYVKAFIMDAIP